MADNEDKREPDLEESSQQQPKRQRRTKWDAPAPTPATIAYGSAPTAPTTAIGLPVVMPPTLSAPQVPLTHVASAAFQMPPSSTAVLPNPVVNLPPQQQLAVQQALMKMNLPSSVTPAVVAAAPSAASIAQRIYVGSIHYDVKESDIVALFSPFGNITKSDMSIDPMTGRSKGFCFLEFSDAASAEAAQAMNGFEFAGRKIKVGRPMHGQGQGAGQQQVGATNMNMMMGVGSAAGGLGGMLGAALGSLGGGLSAGLYNHQAVGGGAAVPAMVAVPQPIVNMLIIRNVRMEILEEDLNGIFSAFGKLVSCKLLDDPKDESRTIAAAPSSSSTVRTRCAVVEYADASIATAAAGAMNNFDLGGALLHVEAASKDKVNAIFYPPPPPKVGKSVLLEQMVVLEDVDDPELKDEIAEEAEKYGVLTVSTTKYI